MIEGVDPDDTLLELPPWLKKALEEQCESAPVLIDLASLDLDDDGGINPPR